MLLSNGSESQSDFRARRSGRYIRDIMWVFFAVFLLGMMTLLISEFDAGARSRVYAVPSSSEGEGGEQRVQTGLKGVVSGVSRMERYSDETRLVSVAKPEENVLAGASGLDRRAIQKNAIVHGTDKAAELGYYAQQAVLENQMSSDEYYTLLQIVEAEATGGDMMSKMMVAGVVLNRVRDSHFPDTIYEVVWQEEQFQPTADGRIYSCEITDSTIEAVERVLQGEDYSQGALFFFARDSAEAQNVSWFDSSLVWLFEYGGHEYFTFREYT